MNWYKLSQNPQANVTVNVGDLANEVRHRLLEIVQHSESEAERLTNYQFNPNMVIAPLQAVQYPNIAEVQSAITSRNEEQLHRASMNIYEWQKVKKDYSLWGKIRQAVNAMQDLSEHISGPKPYPRQQMETDIQNIVQGTQKNLEVIAQQIREAISRIPQWGGSQIVVNARTLGSEFDFQPMTDASVEFIGQQEAWGGAPSFTVFEHEGKLDIDDVLEGGDTDFFTDGPSQNDYFNLISELRKPGSTGGKQGKIITLYTARPVKDRALYMNATQVPANIFLTTNVNMAASWDKEFSSAGPRDVWKVRIDTRYLVQTLDGAEKQYQVTQTAPVKSIELIITGDQKQASSNWYKLAQSNLDPQTLDYAKRHKIQITPDNEFILYHGTRNPTAQLIRQSGYFKAGTCFTEDPAYAATAQDGPMGSQGSKRGKMVVMKIKVDPNMIWLGVRMSAKEPIPVEEVI